MNMIAKLLPRLAPILGFAGVLVFSSCTYNPGYYGPSSGYSYGSSTYAEYPSSNFSTSIFVSTGDPRWGYDPYCHSYYDYSRRCYYDPWLRGYYPRGYRPTVLIGAPHPHGWHRGRNICPPPRHHRDHTLVNYKDRGDSYRKLGQSWSRNVRLAPADSYPSKSKQSRYRPTSSDSDRGNRFHNTLKKPQRDYRSGNSISPSRSSSRDMDPAYLKRQRMEQFQATRPSYSNGRSTSTYRNQPSTTQPKRETTRSKAQLRTPSSYEKPNKHAQSARPTPEPRRSRSSSEGRSSTRGDSSHNSKKDGRSR